MCAAIEWNSQLIKRYGHAALAAGSYPQNSQFHRGVAALDLLRALRSSRQAQRPLSLAVQLPVLAGPRDAQAPHGIGVYLQHLGREIDMLACHLGANQRVQQFHLAGGLPNAVELNRLMEQVQRRFNFQPYAGGDNSIDIDLPHSSWATMGLLRQLGFNHVSIGVPDINPLNGQPLVYFQSPRQTRSLIDAARALDFRSVNIDIGYGRAWQTTGSFARKVAAIIELQPSRVRLFDYAHPPRRYRTLQRLVASGFASLTDKWAMRRHAVEQLRAAGYGYIGLGQYVLADDDLAVAQENGQLHYNCQGFTRHAGCDHLGLGLAASSQIGELHVQNIGDLQHYQQQLAIGQLAVFHGLRCSPDEQLLRAVSERLLCDFQLDFNALGARFGVDLFAYFAGAWPCLEQMHRDGLIQLSEHGLQVPATGRLLVAAVGKALEHGSQSLRGMASSTFNRPSRVGARPARRG